MFFRVKGEFMKKFNIPFSPPDIGEDEINEVCDTLRSGWITTGPKTKQFEKELAMYIGTNKVVCLNSATAAMELTLRILGIGAGDEVIVPAYTYTASCSVICHVGATPVLVDCAPNSFEMDYEAMADAITNKTKMIIPVDIAGIICDYEKIYEVIENKKELYHANNEIQKVFNRIIVLADAAHAFGAIKGGKQCGCFADFTSFSFHAVKNLTTAEGGAITWKSIDNLDDELLYKQYQLYSLHGQSKDALSKTRLGSWEYDIVAPLYKCNMTDIMAAIGLAQLKRYPKMIRRRQEIIYKYNEAFHDLAVNTLNHKDENQLSSGHLYFVRVNGINEKVRNDIITKLAELGVSSNVHYKPLPMLSAYHDLGFKIENFPNAYHQYENEITLPLYSSLSNEQVIYIITSFKEVLKQCG